MADAARYHRLQLLLALLGLGISLAYLLAALLTGAGHAVAYWAARATSARWGQIALVALLLGAGHGALGLPVTLLRSYWLPRRFGRAPTRSASSSPTSRGRVAPPTPQSWVSAARDGSSSSIRCLPISHRRRSSRCSPTSWATMSTATSVAGSSSRVC